MIKKSDKPKRIFIWTTGLDDFFADRGIIGGLTVQLSFWATAFIKAGWEVETLTTHPDNHGKLISGITFTRLKSSRFIAPLQEMLKVVHVIVNKPDLILTRGASRTLFLLSLCCKSIRIKQICMFASDSDLLPGEELIKKSHDRCLWRAGVRLCSRFICQNDRQLELLKQNYHPVPKAIIIPNIWPEPSVETETKKELILWVANFRSIKRPEMFLELAKAFPQEKFIMIGAETSDASFRETRTRAALLPNLQLLGRVPFQETQKYFSRAKLFVCTSQMEGFPNTFLQAFSTGTPVLTTFDPSGIVEQHRLGFTVSDSDGLKKKMRCFLDSEDLQQQFADNARKYFSANHSPVMALRKVERLLRGEK